MDIEEELRGINTILLQKYWEDYKVYFKQPENKHKEKYKWRVLKQVFDNWVWNSEDKAEMFKKAFKVGGSKNLWTSGNFFPIAHTNWMFEEFEEETSSFLNELFNEKFTLTERIDRFLTFYDEKLLVLQKKYPDKILRYHSHKDCRAISLYLYLQYPDKYYLYKFTMAKDFCEQINAPQIKAGDRSNVEKYFQIADYILEFIKKDSSFLDEYHTYTKQDDILSDKSLHLLTQDFIYTVATHFKENKKYWRIGTNDGHISYWNLMQSENKVCIGWKELGNLDEEEIKSKKNIIDLFSTIGYFINDNKTKSRKAGEVYNFYKNINIGDIVLAQEGFSILGIGKVIDDYVYNENDEFPHQKEVEWLVFNPDFKNSQGNRTTAYQITDTDTIKNINDYLQKNSAMISDGMKNIFEQFKKYLEEKGFTKNSVNTYYESVSSRIPQLWKEKYSSEFDAHSFTEETITRLNVLCSGNYNGFFKGKQNFQQFLHSLLKAFENYSPIYYPHNQILYGAPGTGKTYITKKLAVEIITGESYHNRQAINEKYNELKSRGHIRFTTFHQSLGYEDFIEGIKPETNENGEICYEVKDGIFKLLSIEAQKSKKINSLQAEKKYFFDDGWNALIKIILEHQDNNNNFVLKTFSNKELEINSLSNLGNIICKPKIANALEYTLSYNRTKKLFEAFTDLEGITNIDKEFRKIIGGAYSTGYWSILNFINKWIKENSRNVEKASKDQYAKYVLIIDEINRGNISSIFGELITLIEKDKRDGSPEKIETTLPYSQDAFSVPDNLYIIGTMNTADRSIEALDTALRRRFSFIEMQPDSDIIFHEHESGGIISEDDIEINLVKLLDTINSRIELLIDKDHQIGHSYFIQVNNLEDLKLTFKNKVIPLLEEYFYGDYGKIGLVLGSSFIVQKSDQINFAKSFKYGDDGDTSLWSEKVIYEFTHMESWNSNSFVSIYE